MKFLFVFRGDRVREYLGGFYYGVRGEFLLDCCYFFSEMGREVMG